MKYMFLFVLFFASISYSQSKSRPFEMGFSTWIYAPTIEAITGTNDFLKNNGDFYTEQLDEHLPWQALLNNTPWPKKLMEDINGKASRRIKDHKLLLALTALNDDHNGILKDVDGTKPGLDFGSPKIIEAYTKYCDKLISLFKPNYLLIGIESNELLKKSPQLWNSYLIFSAEVYKNLKKKYPSLLISQSITLHVLLNAEVKSPTEYKRKISSLVKKQDFCGVSFYPHFAGYRTEKQFQYAFDFLHKFSRKPIAFTETANIAEPVNIPKYKIVLDSSPAEQKTYLEVLFKNAHKKKYKFISYWAHRDCDKLIEIFPPAFKDIAQIFRDTGLLDEEGRERPAFQVWVNEKKKTLK